MKTLRNTLVLTALLLPIAAFSQRTITVMAGGSADAKPDYATISMTVTLQDNTVVGAFAKNDEFSARLRSALGTAGIQNSDIEMRTFALNPTYDYSQPTGMSPKLVGYHYIGSYTAKVKKLPTLAKALDAASGAGATNVTVEGYGSTKSEDLEEESMKSALKEAREKASHLAKEMGGTIGEIVAISDAESAGGAAGGGGGSEMEREEAERRGAMSGRINPEEVRRSTTLKVTFNVK